jgi:hypothetical protein
MLYTAVHTVVTAVPTAVRNTPHTKLVLQFIKQKLSFVHDTLLRYVLSDNLHEKVYKNK